MTPSRKRSPRAQKDLPTQHPVELTTERVNAAVMSFALLADPTRVRMLWALRDAELDVSSLAGIASCRPTVASQHLSKLRFAGLVEGERHGQRVVYPPARWSRPRAPRRSPLSRRPSGQRHSRPRLTARSQAPSDCSDSGS